MSLPLNVEPSPQISTSSSCIARTSRVPVTARPIGQALDVGLVVLADVRGVRARHGALVAHPGDGDGRVQAAGERDTDAFALGEGGQDLAHGDSFCVDCGAVSGWWEPLASA